MPIGMSATSNIRRLMATKLRDAFAGKWYFGREEMPESAFLGSRGWVLNGNYRKDPVCLMVRFTKQWKVVSAYYSVTSFAHCSR